MTNEQEKENQIEGSELRLAVRPKEAAKALSISIRTLYELLREGQIGFFKLNRAVLIPIAELERFIAQRTQADALAEAQL